MKILTRVLLVSLLATSLVATAQDEEGGPQLSVSGSIDAYYRANLTAPNDGEKPQAPGSSFANQNGFALGMANVILGLQGEKSGFVADLVFGPRGDDAVFGSLSPSGDFSNKAIVNQLYAYWNVSESATLTMGNFNTFLGYEVISPTANFNYSTSYLFSYGPFSHTGVKLDLAPSDDLSFMLAVMNPTDATEFNPVNTATLGAQVGYKGIYLNLIYGDQTGTGDTDNALFQIDLTAGWNLTDALYFGLNASYNATSVENGDAYGYQGAAGYLQYSLSDAFALGTRLEYFSEFENGYGAIGAYDNGDASVFNWTISAQYKVDNLTFIPEIRLDSVSEDIYTDTDGAPQSSLSSFVLAAVYSF